MTFTPGDNVDPAHLTSGAGHDGPTVLCPKGHANSWNYKFCGQCGSPIGLVTWPEDEPAPSSAKSPARSRMALIVGLTAVVAMAVAVSVAVFAILRAPAEEPRAGSGRAENPAAAPPASADPEICQYAPDLTVESMDLTPEGLVVRAAFLSPCGNDIESNSGLAVTAAEGQRDVAAATFDFSTDPLVLESGVPVRRTLLFPQGMYWRTPDMLAEAPSLVATRKGEQNASAKAGTPDSGPMVATKAADPAHGSIDGVAKAVLAELHDSDLPAVSALTNAWVPQVSSKKVGLVAAGKTWSNAEILKEHLGLRQRFAGTRLVWSGDWTTFSQPDFWVTVVAPSHQFPDQANSWCDTQGFATDDCFAKFVSAFFGVPGTTVYRK